MIRAAVITPPDPVLSWDEVRSFLRLETDDGARGHVEMLVAGATGHIDGPSGWLKRCVGPQEIELLISADERALPLRLLFPPIIEIVSISWTSSDGLPRSCDLADVQLFGDTIVTGGAVPWSEMKVGSALRVRYLAGYENVPAPLKVAIGLMTQRLYDGFDIEDAAAGAPSLLLQPFRVFA